MKRKNVFFKVGILLLSAVFDRDDGGVSSCKSGANSYVAIDTSSNAYTRCCLLYGHLSVKQ